MSTNTSTRRRLWFSCRRLISRTATGGAIAAVILAGVALAAAPLPHAGKFYDTSKRPEAKAAVYLLIGSSPTKILKGADIFHTTPGSSVAVPCTKGQAQTGFGGATLKLSGTHYAFTDKYTSHAKILETGPHGEMLVPVTLTMTVKGTVQSTNKITGTVKVKGADGCATAKALTYTANYDPKFTE